MSDISAPYINLDKAPYNKKDFVSRPELNAIFEQIEKLKNGYILYNSLLIVWGISGIGKTWALKHVNNVYSASNQDISINFNRPVVTVYFDFNTVQQSENTSQIVQSLAKALIRKLSIFKLDENLSDLLEKASVSGNAEDFLYCLNSIVESFVLVLLLDTAEIYREWETLEKELIEDLLLLESLLIVIAGRRRSPKWRTFEARDRAKQIEIPPFTPSQLRKRLSHWRESITAELADTMEAITCGSPWLVSLVTDSISSTNDISLSQIRKDEVVTKILQKYRLILTDHISDDQLFYFEKLLPFRYYFSAELKYMLLQENLAIRISDKNLNDILLGLAKYADVVWWDLPRSAYITDPTARLILQRLDLLESKTDYISKHKKCLAFYRLQAKKHKNYNVNHLLEICYHLARIAEANENRDYLEESLQEVVDLAIESRSYPNKAALYNQIDVDAELNRLISDKTVARLKDSLMPVTISA